MKRANTIEAKVREWIRPMTKGELLTVNDCQNHLGIITARYAIRAAFTRLRQEGVIIKSEVVTIKDRQLHYWRKA
jgi:hypothetical protein